MDKPLLLEIDQICKTFVTNAKLFSSKKHVVKAVDGVSLTIGRGETLGLVGESGCGKSTLGNCLMRILRPDSGRVMLYDRHGDPHDFLAIEGEELRRYRRMMQMVFQDPYSSINPRMTVKDVVGEPLLLQKMCETDIAYERRVAELLETVGLSAEFMERYPHAFSGGQRQRIGIARALATNPEFILCDEAVSALDVSVRAQIINLFMDLQERLNLSYLFISHDLSVVRHISNRVAVMYLGRIVEQGTIDDIFNHPLHPYTSLLLSAVPIPNPNRAKKGRFTDNSEGVFDFSRGGCGFYPRCKRADASCLESAPSITNASSSHQVACHRPEESRRISI